MKFLTYEPLENKSQFMNQEMQLLCLYIKVKGGGVRSVRYPPKRYKSEYIKRSTLGVDLQWGAGIGDFTLDFILHPPYSEDALKDQVFTFYFNKFLFDVPIEFTYLSWYPWVSGRWTWPYDTKSRDPQLFLPLHLLTGKKEISSLSPWEYLRIRN
jgi:hypothetical protein